MKKNNIIKYKKHIALGAVCITLTGMIIVAGNISTSANSGKKDNGSTIDESFPTAGIAKLLVNDKEVMDDEITQEFTGGIASVLFNYYNYSIKEDSNLSIKAVDTVLKMLPEETMKETPDNTEVSSTDVTGEDNNTQQTITSVVDGYTVLGVANVTNYLNVRETPDLEGKLLGKLPMNAGCEILESLDGWYKISSGNVEGYVSAEFLLTGEEANQRAKEELSSIAKVNADMLMVREEANTDCTILTRVAEGEELEAVEEIGRASCRERV